MKKRLCLILLAVAILIQFVPVERENPPETAPLWAPAPVKAVLERSCYDCHSNLTAWPWYGRVAPVSWYLSRNVSRGREHLNFSAWRDLPAKTQRHALKSVIERIETGEMPPRLHRLVHPETAVSDEDLAALKSWAAVALNPALE